MDSRRFVLRAALLPCVAALGFAAPLAQAQKWPEKMVRIVVAGPPGGSADIVARFLADGLAKEIGQPVIVEPKPGAGGVLAVNELSQAPRDGHTLLVGVNSLVSEIPHIMKLRVDMAKEITPVAELARGGLVMVGAPSLAAKNFSELVGWVKANPGKVNYASYTAGTISHVMGLQLNKAAGLDMVHVGYKGSTPALTDVMGGHVPLMFDGMPTSLPLIKSGKIKAYAVSTQQRSTLLPDVPDLPRARLSAARGRGVDGLVGESRGACAGAGEAARGRAQGAGSARGTHALVRDRLRSGAAPQPRGTDQIIDCRLRTRGRGAQVDRVQAGVRLSPIGGVAAKGLFPLRFNFLCDAAQSRRYQLRLSSIECGALRAAIFIIVSHCASRRVMRGSWSRSSLRLVLEGFTRTLHVIGQLQTPRAEQQGI